MRATLAALGFILATSACGGGGDGDGGIGPSQQDRAEATIGTAGGTVVVPSGAAGVVIPPGTFTQAVTVTVARIESSSAPGNGPLATSLRQYGPFYELTTSPQVQQFGDSVRVGVCQVTDPSSQSYPPEPHSSLRLAHTVGSGIEILQPVNVNDFLRCTNVNAQNSHSSFLARAVHKFFGPSLLYAAHGGLGGKTKSFSPFGAVQLAGNNLQLASVSAGRNFSCALTTQGKAYCWGTLPENNTLVLQPALVNTQVTFTSIMASWDHACAVSDGNSLFCWGLNNNAQVGNRTTNSPVYPPEAVFGARAFSTGQSDQHTCAIEFTTNRAFCWGRNNFGQLGRGDVDDSAHTQPFPVSISGATPTTWTNLSVGPRHTCGSSGTFVFCWGDNNDGKLGDGTATNRSVPTKVASTIDFTTVSAGTLHTCALTVSGAAYCWGQNFRGQLGTGGTVQNQFTPVPVAGGLLFRSLTAGSDFTCGITTAGNQAFCWGANDLGQLGDGTTTDRGVPTLVIGGLAFDATSAGANHACGHTSSGIYCWGNNSGGALGDGTTTNRTQPVRVSGQQ